MINEKKNQTSQLKIDTSNQPIRAAEIVTSEQRMFSPQVMATDVHLKTNLKHQKQPSLNQGRNQSPGIRNMKQQTKNSNQKNEQVNIEQLAPPTHKNLFTHQTIPAENISSRALKLLSGDFAQSNASFDPNKKLILQIHDKSHHDYLTKKAEQTENNTQFNVLNSVKKQQKVTTIIPSAFDQSPIKPAPIFRQASIWKNSQGKSTMMDQLEQATVMKNRHYNYSPTIAAAHNESVLMSDNAKKESFKETSWNDLSTSIGQQHPIFSARNAQNMKQNPTDRSHLQDVAHTINTVRSNNDTGFDVSMITKPQDGLFADTSIFQPASSKEYQLVDNVQPSSVLGQPSADELMQRPSEQQPAELINKGSAKESATFGQEQSSFWKKDFQNQKAPMNASQELEALHMYDSLLLGKTISQVQLNQLQRRQRFNISIHSMRQQSEHDWATSSMGQKPDINLKIQNFQEKRQVNLEFDKNLERQFRRPSKATLLPLKGGSQHLEKRHYSMNYYQQHMNMLDSSAINKDAANVTDSSAKSNINVVDLGLMEVETIKGTNIRQLSPITRQLNKLSGATLNQIEAKIQALSFKQELKDNILLRLQQKGLPIEESNALIERNTKLVKILKNQLKTLVAPDEEKYQVVLPNCNFEVVEVLPQGIPTYLKIPCSLLKSPCQFEIYMNDLDAMHVMMSTEHKFPQEDKQQFEKEKLVLQDMSLLMKLNQRGQSKDQKKKKMSILLIEASSKSQKKTAEQQMQRKPDGTQIPAPIKRSFRFAKPNFKENFDDGDNLYVTLISQNGGTIRLRVEFPSSQAGNADHQNLVIETKAAKRRREKAQEPISPSAVENELNSWFKDNMHLLDSCKHLFQDGALDFVQLNKGSRLELSSYKNLALEHQRKIWLNQMKMDSAKHKAQQNQLYKYYKNKKNLSKWEDYRETKIELTAILIKVLKRKNFTRKWLRIQKQGQIYAKIRQNLFIRRHLNHILFTSLKCAIRFKINYKYIYQKQYGFDITKRKLNLLRRTLNFGAICKHNTVIDDVIDNLGGFIFNTFLCFNLSKQFTKFNDNLIFVQEQRKHLMMTREFRFLFIYKRMEIIKDILIPIYNKKKTKKYAKKITQGLKKVMDRSRTEDFSKVKQQFGLWGSKTMRENQNLLDSIKIRSLTITAQILGMSTKKNEDGEKIHKVEIENIKQEIDIALKKVRLRSKTIDEIDRDLIGISDKEIKEINKKASGRKPDAKTISDAAYHKFDTSKIFKDDKLLKSIKTSFIKALTQPKKQSPKKSKGKKGAKTAGPGAGTGDEPDAEEPDGVNETGDVEGDGADGAEGADGDMEGDGEGDGADAEGADGEAGEAEGEADGDGAAEAEAEGDGEADAGEQAGDDAEVEAGEGQEGDQQITMNASMEDLGAEGDGADAEQDEADGTKSPKKKKAGRSVSKGKKKSKNEEDTITVIKQKESSKAGSKDGGKTKKKWVLDEKIDTPEDILNQIDYLKIGIENITVEQVKYIVREKYFMIQKRKLSKITEENKAKTNLTILTKMMLHMALNIGPQAKVNEDIEEQLKDQQQNLAIQNQQSTQQLELVKQQSVNQVEATDKDLNEASTQNQMGETHVTKKKSGEVGTKSAKSGGSLHPSQCSRKSKKKQPDVEQKSQQSKMSQQEVDPEIKDHFANTFVTDAGEALDQIEDQ